MFLAALTSVWVCRITIQLAARLRFGGDETDGVQKFHAHWVPRLGGVPVFLALVASLLGLAKVSNTYVVETAFLILCLLPAFGVGLVEDLTRSAGVLSRLIMTMVAAAIGWWLLGAQLNRLDLPFVDGWLQQYSLLAFVLTLVAAGGVAHAVNIVDGCNGLSGFFCIAALVAIGIVAGFVGDSFVMQSALIAAAAIAGFLFWNFPFGRIFFGDAGAYLAGFLIAELSILLVVRNPAVSAWFPMLLMIYPVWETLFSMYRRAVVSGTSVGHPDALHLHQLIYRRIMRRVWPIQTASDKVLANSFTSLYLWVLALLCAIPAVLFWNSTPLLMLSCLGVVLLYMSVYRRVVRFRTPAFMMVRGSMRGDGGSADASSNLEELEERS